MRHAHAANPGFGARDHSRVLTGRGILEAQHMGKIMRDRNWQPKRVIASNASRTTQTAQQVVASFSAKIPLETTEKLYLATASDILSLVQEISDDIRSVLIVAHNPGIHSLAMMLADEGKTADHRLLLKDFPPGSLVVLDFQAESWLDIRSRTGTLRATLTPPDNLL